MPGEAETDAAIFEYTLPGSGVRLYKNRIEQWRTLVPFLWKSRTTVPLRNVATVEKGATGAVTVVTNDGKRHRFVAGFQAERLRQAILELL